MSIKKDVVYLTGSLLSIAATWFILVAFPKKQKRNRGRLTADFTGFKTSDFSFQGVLQMAEIKEGQKATVTVTPRTRKGNPANYQKGTAQFTSSDESVVSVTQNPDNELEATVRGLDGSANESVVVEFRCDADPSDGVKEIVSTVAITCTQGDALTATMTLGNVQDDDQVGQDATPTAPVDQTPAETPVDPTDTAPVDDTPANPAPVDDAPPADPASPVDTDPAPADPDKVPDDVPAPADPAAPVDTVPADPGKTGDGDPSNALPPQTDGLPPSDQAPGNNAEPMTFDQAADDTAKRNDDEVPPNNF